MQEGSVKWYNPQKGYGFLKAPGIDKDIFVHADLVKKAGVQSLSPEQIVHFEYVEAERGLCASALVIGDCPHCSGTGWTHKKGDAA